MIFERHPMVAEASAPRVGTPCLRAAVSAAQSLDGVLGWSPPSWTALANGERPESHPPEEFETGARRGGWQHEAASRTEQRFRDVELFARLDDTGQALLRSQGGPGAGLALTACPLCRVTSIEPQLFRVLLLRRLHLPLPLTARHCRCGLPLDSRGHHRAACARVGILGRRGYPLENVVVRICREAGRRVTTNVLVRDLDLAEPNAADARRLEVVADGLPLFGGAQLAVDRRYPELVGRRGRARLVVLAVEVCGRWSQETQRFLSSLARAKARSVPPSMRKRVEQAWRLRWGSLFSCTVARQWRRPS